jgi:hypothetical protein
LYNVCVDFFTQIRLLICAYASETSGMFNQSRFACSEALKGVQKTTTTPSAVIESNRNQWKTSIAPALESSYRNPESRRSLGCRNSARWSIRGLELDVCREFLYEHRQVMSQIPTVENGIAEFLVLRSKTSDPPNHPRTRIDPVTSDLKDKRFRCERLFA